MLWGHLYWGVLVFISPSEVFHKLREVRGCFPPQPSHPHPLTIAVYESSPTRVDTIQAIIERIRAALWVALCCPFRRAMGESSFWSFPTTAAANDVSANKSPYFLSLMKWRLILNKGVNNSSIPENVFY